MHAIEKELVEATQLKKNVKETNINFYKRLIKHATDDLDDDDWEKLTDATQEWVNNAVNAVNDKKDFPGFPGEDGKPMPIKKAARTKKKAPTKKAEKPKKVSGITSKIKTIMLSRPEISKDELIKQLESDGAENLSKNTVDVYWSDMRQTCEIMRKNKSNVLDWLNKTQAP